MKNVIVLMTALLPTKGHADLIDFASALPNSHVYVLINGRSFEPIPTRDRLEALTSHFEEYHNITIKASNRDNAPQNPEDMPEGFWEWWADEINRNFPETGNNWGYVVASEPYGLNVAHSIGAEFIPYDIDRIINPVRGTETRADIRGEWDTILLESRQQLTHNVVMFGQESVGKTTMSRAVAEKFQTAPIMEFARPYLEAVGEELSEFKMRTITLGQASLQRTVRAHARTPINVFDTDLYSTVGYYKMWDGEAPELCTQLAKETKGDKYYVLPDDIPFEPDILRYGDGERESSTGYWVKLLEEYGLSYVRVPKGTFEEKLEFIVSDIETDIDTKYAPIKNFNRE